MCLPRSILPLFGSLWGLTVFPIAYSGLDLLPAVVAKPGTRTLLRLRSMAHNGPKTGPKSIAALSTSYELCKTPSRWSAAPRAWTLLARLLEIRTFVAMSPATLCCEITLPAGECSQISSTVYPVEGLFRKLVSRCAVERNVKPPANHTFTGLPPSFSDRLAASSKRTTRSPA